MSKPTNPRSDFLHALLQCNHAETRELGWAVGSSPLLSDAPEQHLLSPDFFDENWRERLDWLLSIDASEEKLNHLRNLLNSGSQRLGKRFERLVTYWFESHPRWTVEKSNWVVSDAKRTIGEFDLIALNNDTGAYWHFELACKFYLSSKNTRHWNTWKGTNVRDDLQHKMDKLEQQLRLSDHPAAFEPLNSNGIEIEHRAVWMKGWFFHHFRDISHSIPPRSAHRHCNVGWWCTQSEWHKWMSQSSSDWIELSSLEWLQPIHSISCNTLHANQIIEKWIQQPFDRHQMLAQVIHREGKFVELSRGFVVHDDWPAQSRLE